MRPRFGLVALAIAATAACGGPARSEAPSLPEPAAASGMPGAPSPTIEQTTTFAPTASRASPFVFVPNSIAAVVSGPLRVRSEPNVADASVKFEPLLETGQQLFVIKGPVVGSGYDWYLVDPQGREWEGAAVGWVAAADRDGTPWIAPTRIGCSNDPTVHDFTAAWFARIYCYGSGVFGFSGTLTGPEPLCEGERIASPAWLSDCGRFSLWSSRGELLLEVAAPPDLASPTSPIPVDRLVNVIGHFDDPVARTCTSAAGSDPIANETAIYICRLMFVASAIEDVGPAEEPVEDY